MVPGARASFARGASGINLQGLVEFKRLTWLDRAKKGTFSCELGTFMALEIDYRKTLLPE